VAYADGLPEQYCLWLGLRDAPDGRPVVARLATGPSIVDVSADPASAAALLRRLADGADLASANGGVLRFGDVSDEARALLAKPTRTRALGADQSNTSIEVGGALVFKLFRRVQPGENPEVEIGRFLTTCTTFRDFSPLHGSVTYLGPRDEPCTVGVLQAWVPNRGDGWRYVQEQLAGELACPGSWATASDEMRTLGAITAGFHQASASDPTRPAFAPEPIGPSHASGWTAAVRSHAAQAVRHVWDSRLEHDERTRLTRALTRAAAIDTALLPSTTAPDASLHAIRIHGDFHLGQTLKTTAGFVLIDFEGEPTRTVEERRRKHCALKDVAGMLRSFEYAIAVACADAPDRMDTLRKGPALAPAFLDGYFGAPGMAQPLFLPRDPVLRAQWIRFFEIEKALYELDYELNNRPDWAHIPARGLLRMLDA